MDIYANADWDAFKEGIDRYADETGHATGGGSIVGSNNITKGNRDSASLYNTKNNVKLGNNWETEENPFNWTINSANQVQSSSTGQADQALNTANTEAQATAQANKTANINAGMNKSRAGMLGSQASNSTQSNAVNYAAGNRASNASTQADYLQKMAAADGLDQQASNMDKAAGLAALSGALQGAGSGASTGAAMQSTISDENAKQDPVDDDKLNEAIKQFKTLYAKVKQLRGDK